jgi:hypothetical protein
MKNITRLIISILVLFFSFITSNAQVSGLAFRDLNSDGTRQTAASYSEPLANGIIVRAYNSSEVLVASDTTGSNGTFGTYALSITAATQVRLEFLIASAATCISNSLIDFSSGGGSSYGSAVKFVTAGAGAVNINFAINNPGDYVKTAPPTTTDTLFVVRQISGNPAGGGTSGSRNAFYKVGYHNEQNTINATYQTDPLGSVALATNAQIGSCYGVGYSPYARKVFTAAYMKRHYGLGPANGTFNNAPGAIYMIDPSLTAASPAASYFGSLDALGFPTHNSSGSPAYGSGISYNTAIAGSNGYRARVTYTTNGLGVIGTNTDRILPAAYTTVSSDPAALGQVGKVSLGDLDVSEDGSALYVTNLYDRKLYKLQLNSTTNPTAVSTATGYTLPNPPLRSTSGITNAAGTYTGGNDNVDFYNGTRGFQRPFAVAVNRGKIYVGAVTTGEIIGASTTIDDNLSNPEYTDLWAYVWEFNPTTNTFNTTPVLQFPLNFNRGTNADGTNESWKLWRDTIPSPVSGAGSENTALQFVQYQQAMISDIAFDTSNVMVIGFRDRWGDMTGYDLPSVNGSGRIAGQAMGDLLRAYYNQSTCSYELESNGKEGPSSTKAATSGTPAGGGPGNGEFYHRDHVYDANDGSPTYTFHLNTLMGGLALIKGTDTLAITAMDPLRAWSGGISWFSNTTGDNGRDYEMYSGAGTGDFPAPPVGEAGKTYGLGDIELLSYLPPLEIGNRVWNDVNGDGIQNANETGIANVTIQLYSNGTDGIAGTVDDVSIGTTTTDANGNWYFNAANITDGDPVTAGNQTGPQPNFSYNVRINSADWSGGVGIADLANYQLTKTDKLSNGAIDLSDNDASLNSSTIPMISITTGAYGQNNHNIDFGFRQLASIGDKVWKDDDKDGIQDSGEPGVAGITVMLYQNGADNNPGTTDDILIGTTVTDAYGNYIFDNLAPTTSIATEYNVGFTLPANYQFTTQTNTQVAGSSDATNTTTTTGGSTAANGSDASVTTGRTGGFWLTAGEAETGADAGIIFSQPTTNSIGDKVWYDANGNNTQDASEAGVAGVTVTLYNNSGVAIATTVTDANGNYLFAGLADGNYRVGFTLPAGMQFASKGGDNTSGGASDSNTDSDVNISGVNTGKTDLIDLDASSTSTVGVNYTNIDAGLVQQSSTTASIGDKVWLDLNSNNIQDANEPGVAGVTVNLYQDVNGDGFITGGETTPVGTTVTDAFGNYIFNNLFAGPGNGTVYQVGFVLPSGYTFVTPNTGTDDFLDSDANTYAGGYSGTYYIKPGQRNLSVDAGLVQNSPAGSSSIGDYVWFDADSDGVQDATETGVAGVTVTLYNSSGTAIATTTTDANGKYIFANLAAADYSVGFSNLPAGYSFTSSAGTTTGNATTNSDANVGTGRTTQFTLPAATSLTGLDAGLIAGVSSGLGSLGNKVWWDIVTNNNVQDAGEPGVAGVTVTLSYDSNGDGDFIDAGEASYKTTTTNSLGEYLFTGLPAGNYQVAFTTLPASATAVTSNSGSDDTIDSDGATTGVYTLAAGEDNLTVDLGIVNSARGALGNRVWFDNGAGGGTANDGIQNGTEVGVAGVMVTLVNASGQTVDRNGTVTTSPVITTTDANGYYAFADLNAGTAFGVKFTNLPAGFDFTTKAGVGSGDDSRSDADISNGSTPTVTIIANTFNATLDAGIISQRAALGNKVWLDTDGNGTQANNSTEPGIAGVTVTLYRPGFGPDGIAGNGDDALAVASMITDQNGNYLFSNLIAGTYEVGFSTLPGGLNFTKQNTPGDTGDDTNSDAIPVSGNISVGRTGSIILNAGETDLTIDAGLFKPRAVIGNYVWADTNNDGVQQTTEPGAAGIMVSLTDASTGTTIAIAITDANGYYLFPNVAPSTTTYTLSFTNLPSGSAFTTANAGGDDNADSDVSGSTITGIVVTTTTTNLSFDAGIIGFRTLPAKIELIATKQTNKSILVWKVTAERDVKNYTLERSANGNSYIAIYATGANGAAEYTNTDVQPLSGINYYRVRVENMDGSIEYSAVRMLRFDSKGAILVFPNPVTNGQVSIQLPDSWQNKPLTLAVYNQLGQVVISKTQSRSSQVETLNISQLPAGNYLLHLNNGINSETQKVQIR